MSPAENLDKLPKWARDRIINTERQIQEERAYSSTLGAESGRISIVNGLERVTYFPGNYEHVRFLVNRRAKNRTDLPELRYWIDIRLVHENEGRGDWLRIQGEQTLKITPDASNSFNVAVQDVYRPEEERP